MKDTDKVQTWVYNIRRIGGYDWGRIDTQTVEIVDFEKGTVSVRVTGIDEGEKVDTKYSFKIYMTATPEKCAAYRRNHGYKRIS